MRHRFWITIGFCLLGMSSPRLVSAQFTGSLAWDYAQYAANEAGVEVVDASSFAQRYSLMFQKDGKIMGGRGGNYGFTLGGEWLSVDSEQDIAGTRSKFDVSKGKLLYRGDFLFAPGGLPFRFHAYGRDLSHAMFESNANVTHGILSENYLTGSTRSLLTSKVIGDISDGQHVEYGASVVLGIKNGSYLGRYRNILAHLPKLYADYHELRVRDMKSATPENYKERELAFVSLNKKHNWFHYRYFDHQDYVNPAEDYYERTYLLGTIDQDLHREWVNLTNWIQLSADASYVSTVKLADRSEDEHNYAANLFMKTSRSHWRSTTLSRFWRKETADDLERVLQVPVYAAGEADRDNGWYLTVVGKRVLHERPYALISTESAKDDVYAKGRWETHRSRAFTLASYLATESKFGDEGRGRAAKAGVEYYSTKNKKAGFDLFSDVIIGYFWGERAGAVSDNNGYFEASGRFDLARNLSSRSRAGMESQFIIGTGFADGVMTDTLSPELASAMPTDIEDGKSLNVDGTAWRAKAGLFYEHSSLEGVRNRVESALDYADLPSRASTQVVISHRLDQRKSLYDYMVTTELALGDHITRSINSVAFGVALGTTAFSGFALSHDAALSVTPNRSHRVKVSERIDWIGQDKRDDGYLVGFTQDYTYSKYVYSGLVRKLFELKEYLDYEIMSPNSDTQYQAVSLTGDANYFPFRWMRLGSRLRWVRDIEAASDDVAVGLYSNFDFALLDVALQYEYGMRTEGDSGAPLDRDEQSWKISISKTF